jgi:uncharacterized membrane-anchored protein YitT (DUF2179 family)
VEVYMKISKQESLDILFRIFIVIFTNTVLSIATVWFLEPSELYAGGATGIAQLIFRLIKLGAKDMSTNLLGWFILGVNIPITLIGFNFVSKRFAIYSVLAVGIQSLVVLVIPESPFKEMANEIVTYDASGNMVKTMNYGGILTLAIFGGLLAGMASGLALRFGVSTGGVDVLAHAISMKKGISIGNFTMALNIGIAIVGGGWLQNNWFIALFTIVRMILNSLVIDKLHTSYSHTGLHIFSTHGEAIAHSLMSSLNRGCTLIDVEGAHSGKGFKEVYCVVSNYEIHRDLKEIKKHDEKAFITMSPVKTINGNFIRKSMI